MTTKHSANFDQFQPQMAKVLENVNKVIVGKQETVELTLVAILARGHILLEDVPGVGKTILVRSLAKSLGCTFKRIQFTPDLLPSDVTGVSIYNQKEGSFEFRKGPVFGHVVLADEINRTSPKTQSALLEAMEEGNVTVDGETKSLPEPFMVMATQNPIEYEGTYPLPEAQLDRFLLKLNMGYPTPEEELEVLSRTQQGHPIDELEAVISIDELKSFQAQAKQIHIDETVKQYIIHLTHATREHEDVYLGASPRGSLALLRAIQALAFIRGRDYVIPDDVKFLAPYTLKHRVILKSEARLNGVTVPMVLKEILQKVTAPVLQGHS